MKIIKSKWQWTPRYPIYADDQDFYYFWISPGPDYVLRHDGFVLWFSFLTQGPNFGHRKWGKKFKTWNDAHKTGEKVMTKLRHKSTNNFKTI